MIQSDFHIFQGGRYTTSSWFWVKLSWPHRDLNGIMVREGNCIKMKRVLHSQLHRPELMQRPCHLAQWRSNPNCLWCFARSSHLRILYARAFGVHSRIKRWEYALPQCVMQKLIYEALRSVCRRLCLCRGWRKPWCCLMLIAVYLRVLKIQSPVCELETATQFVDKVTDKKEQLNSYLKEYWNGLGRDQGWRRCWRWWKRVSLKTGYGAQNGNFHRKSWQLVGVLEHFFFHILGI